MRPFAIAADHQFGRPNDLGYLILSSPVTAVTSFPVVPSQELFVHKGTLIKVVGMSLNGKQAYPDTLE